MAVQKSADSIAPELRIISHNITGQKYSTACLLPTRVFFYFFADLIFYFVAYYVCESTHKSTHLCATFDDAKIDDKRKATATTTTKTMKIAKSAQNKATDDFFFAACVSPFVYTWSKRQSACCAVRANVARAESIKCV